LSGSGDETANSFLLLIAMWGTFLAAGGLVLFALKPSPLRAAIGFLLALIPPAFVWLISQIPQ